MRTNAFGVDQGLAASVVEEQGPVNPLRAEFEGLDVAEVG
eukprot:CAMPEP_0170500764 /NCGR_PEP_ID=MMETSP0208-20121228/35995_1 /TAXON_ID=197538 /ORGANISM="Strombidium inclinatum, Strain S3" /LENGTH=39 /DNA_ID= /DNA_START= /DNA_END= /DNA_ORIENTATION=